MGICSTQIFLGDIFLLTSNTIFVVKIQAFSFRDAMHGVSTPRTSHGKGSL